MKKLALLTFGMLGVTSAHGATMTIQQLQNKEQEDYALLSEHWVDKEGVTHAGNKDPKELQFAFSESLMKRQSVDQIKASMNTAISRFSKEQKAEFIDTVKPYLDDLAAIRNEMKSMHDKLDGYAATLAQYLKKTPEEIMRYPKENIEHIITDHYERGTLSSEKKIELRTKVNVNEFDALRTAFDITTVAEPIAKKTSASRVAAAEAEDEEEEEAVPVKKKSGGSGTGSKVASVASAALSGDFKISKMVTSIADWARYSNCTDRHYDIVQDSDGIQFITIAK